MLKVAIGFLSLLTVCAAGTITLPAVAITGGSSTYTEYPPTPTYDPWATTAQLTGLDLSFSGSSGSGSHPCCYPGIAAALSYSNFNSDGSSLTNVVLSPPLVPSPVFAGSNVGPSEYNGVSLSITTQPNGTFTGMIDIFEQQPGTLTGGYLIPIYGDYVLTQSGNSGTYVFTAQTPEPGTTWLAFAALPLFLLAARHFKRTA